MTEPVNVKKLLGNRIKEIRKERKITQEKLAELIDIEPNNVSKIENGKNYPSAENLAKIAQALNTEIHELFIFNQHKPIEEIKSYVIREVEQNDNLARTLFKFCQAVRHI